MATAINSTAAALLGLLHDGPMTGGELVAAAKERMEPFWSVTRSQVYRELPGLAAAGYDHSRNPLVLRVGFGAHHQPGAVAELVAEAKVRHQEALATGRSRVNRLKKEGADPFLVSTAEFGVAYERAMLRWLDTVPTD